MPQGTMTKITIDENGTKTITKTTYGKPKGLFLGTKDLQAGIKYGDIPLLSESIEVIKSNC